MKKQLIAAAVLAGALSTPALALDVSGNAGFVSNYIWRGADQSNGKIAAQGGLDLSAGDGPVQFYAGTWLSTVEYEFIDPAENPDSDSIRGMEVDLYLGINGAVKDFGWAVGGTVITYTDEVNPDYFEGNISLSYKWIGFDTAIGKYDNPGLEQNYVWAALNAEYNGFFGFLGYTEWEEGSVPTGALADGGYFELGYANTLSWEGKELFDYSISYLYTEADNLTANQAQNNLIFGITKNFGIYSK